MMEIQFDLELDTPLSGKTDFGGLTNGEYKREKRRGKKKKNGDATPHSEWGDDDSLVYPSTSSPSVASRNNNTTTTKDKITSSTPSSRSPKAYLRSSLPHPLTLAAEKRLQTTTVVTPSSQQIIKETASYHQVKMKYMRSLNFTPEELKSLRMRGRERSMSVPMGQSMPIPVSGLHGPDMSSISASLSEVDDAPFVPPHELVRHDDTFSVWHYEQKKIASKDAV